MRWFVFFCLVLVARAAEPAPGSVEELIAKARDLRKQGRPLEALPVFREALKRAEPSLAADPRRHVMLLGSLANCLQVKGDLDEALAIARRGLDLAAQHATTEPAGWVMSELGVGSILTAQEKFDEALPHLERAYGRADGDRRLTYYRMILLADLGNHWNRRDNFARGLALATEAFAMLEAVKRSATEEAAVCLVNTADALLGLGRLEEARGKVNLAIAILEQLKGKESVELGPAHASLGHILSAMGDHPAAIAELERSVRLMEPGWGPNNLELAYALEWLGTAYRRAGRAEDQKKAQERARAIRKHAGVKGF